MRVLFVSLDVHEGGAGRCVRELLEKLPTRGIQVEAWVARTGPNPPPNVRCFRRGWERRFDLLEFFPGWTDWRHRGSIAALGSVTADQFDVVHLHTIHNGAASIRAVHDLCRRLPAVWTLHDEWAASGGLTCDLRGRIRPSEIRRLSGGLRRFIPYSPYHDSLRSWSTKRLLAKWMPRPRIVLTPGTHVAERAKTSGRFPQSEIRVVRNGTCLGERPEATLPRDDARRQLGLPPDRPVVLMLAAHLGLPHKGVAFGAAALNRLSRSEPHVLLVGSHADSLRPLIHRPVVCLPVQDDGGLARAYRAADVTLIPSLAECFPTVGAESMACGTPLAGFAVGGLREQIGDDERGLSAAPYSVPELADRLDRLLADAALRARLGEAGAAWVRAECDMNDHLSAVVRAYEDARAAGPA